MEETRYGLSIGPEPNPKHLLRGKDEILGKAGAIMAELGKMLWIDGKKFRVTIIPGKRAYKGCIYRSHDRQY